MIDNTPSSYPHKSVVLIVEDDSVMNEVIELTLAEDKTLDAIVLSDPCEALQIALQARPDLFVLDYLLPGMTGIELYDQLHATEGLTDIPAIIMSASLPWHLQEVVDRKLLALQKPFDLDYFLDAIRHMVAVKHAL